MNKTITYILLIFVSIVLGLTSIMTPKVKTEEASFSAERAFEHIEVIAQEPHTIEDVAALKDVRDYLHAELTSLGLNPVIHKFNQTDEDYDITEVNNIVAQIDGTSDSYILLMAHYDSSPAKRIGEEAGSKGAADDGYGLSTILETIRTLQARDVAYTNGIKILFTDAEEIGLYGAKKEIEKNPEWFEDVALVINIEARGVKGPNVMFQTSLDNYRIMKFYQKASYPVSFSLAGDVYSNMPNSTDLTPMLEEGLAGINMSVLDNLDYYHTPADNPENVSLTSLQQYGENVLPLVQEFVTNDRYSDVDYFTSNQGAMYFTLLPNVFVVFSETTQVVFVVITMLLILTNIYFSIRSKELKAKLLGIDFLILFGLSILMAVDGAIVSYIISLISGVPFSLTYMPNIGGALVIFIVFALVVTVVGAYLIKQLINRRKQTTSMLYGIILLFALWMVLLTSVLPGGAYMFMIPLFVLNLILLLNHYMKHQGIANDQLYNRLELVPVIVTIMLFSPVLYLLYIALTIGALAVINLFLSFPLFLAAILIYKQFHTITT